MQVIPVPPYIAPVICLKYNGALLPCIKSPTARKDHDTLYKRLLNINLADSTRTFFYQFKFQNLQSPDEISLSRI
jgi:hypothetical protein